MRGVVITLALLGTFVCGPAGSADEPAKRSAELQVLDRFAGTWDVEMTVKLPGQQANSHNSVETRKLSRGGGVILFENSESPEFHMLWTYDAKAKKYTGIWLTGADRGQVTGTWDERTTAMKLETTGTDGMTGVSTFRFIDKDHSENSAEFRDPAGKVVSEVTWKHSRKR
jgi:hypothetical protein